MKPVRRSGTKFVCEVPKGYKTTFISENIAVGVHPEKPAMYIDLTQPKPEWTVVPFQDK